MQSQHNLHISSFACHVNIYESKLYLKVWMTLLKVIFNNNNLDPRATETSLKLTPCHRGQMFYVQPRTIS